MFYNFPCYRLIKFCSFKRECEAEEDVPENTIVMADCWGVSTMILKCHKDGKWHQYDVGVEEALIIKPMKEICQPQELNSASL